MNGQTKLITALLSYITIWYMCNRPDSAWTWDGKMLKEKTSITLYGINVVHNTNQNAWMCVHLHGRRGLIHCKPDFRIFKLIYIQECIYLVIARSIQLIKSNGCLKQAWRVRLDHNRPFGSKWKQKQQHDAYEKRVSEILVMVRTRVMRMTTKGWKIPHLTSPVRSAFFMHDLTIEIFFNENIEISANI